MEVLEEDKQLVRNINDAYKDVSTHVVMVKGFCDNDKLVDVVVAATKINDNPKIKLRTRSLMRTKDLLQRAFSRYFKGIKISFSSSSPFVFGRLQESSEHRMFLKDFSW